MGITCIVISILTANDFLLYSNYRCKCKYLWVTTSNTTRYPYENAGRAPKVLPKT